MAHRHPCSWLLLLLIAIVATCLEFFVATFTVKKIEEDCGDWALTTWAVIWFLPLGPVMLLKLCIGAAADAPCCTSGNTDPSDVMTATKQALFTGLLLFPIKAALGIASDVCSLPTMILGGGMAGLAIAIIFCCWPCLLPFFVALGLPFVEIVVGSGQQDKRDGDDSMGKAAFMGLVVFGPVFVVILLSAIYVLTEGGPGEQLQFMAEAWGLGLAADILGIVMSTCTIMQETAVSPVEFQYW